MRSFVRSSELLIRINAEFEVLRPLHNVHPRKRIFGSRKPSGPQPQSSAEYKPFGPRMEIGNAKIFPGEIEKPILVLRRKELLSGRRK